MRLRTLTLVAAMLLPLGSCTSKDSSADAEAKPEAGGVETVEIPVGEPPRIEVHDEGQEPRHPLRLRVTAGTEEDLEMSMGMRMAMDTGAQRIPPMQIPTSKTRLHAKVESVSGDTFEVRQSVSSVEVIPMDGSPPEVADKMRESLAPLTSYRALMSMSDRGTVLGGKVEIPRDLPPMVHNTMQQMTQSLGQIAVPMPEPAVGPGARWTAVNELSQNGMRLRQTSDYTLVSWEGERALISLTVRQELVDPDISVPGMLGAKARVSDFRSSGEGSVELEPGHVTPSSMHMAMELAMTMDVTVMGQSQHMDMEMGIDLTMELVD
ncbi:MAG: hypothetical protein H6712_18665 [Myxococcales bacterium]|nr:hypothetical protein [Myxococcales bacterium]MCB9715897.1 hypothetical protein [Myxococcales bacterium]